MVQENPPTLFSRPISPCMSPMSQHYLIIHCNEVWKPSGVGSFTSLRGGWRCRRGRFCRLFTLQATFASSNAPPSWCVSLPKQKFCQLCILRGVASGNDILRTSMPFSYKYWNTNPELQFHWSKTVVISISAYLPACQQLEISFDCEVILVILTEHNLGLKATICTSYLSYVIQEWNICGTS